MAIASASLAAPAFGVAGGSAAGAPGRGRFDPPARSASAYECYVGDALNWGYRAGWVDASGSVDCRGFGAPGSVRFTVRLQRRETKGKLWHTANTATRRYHDLRRRHLLSVSRHCRDAFFRGIFTAVLFDSAGRRVSTNRQVLGPAHVPANCSAAIR